jgi:hypothetical protein
MLLNLRGKKKRQEDAEASALDSTDLHLPGLGLLVLAWTSPQGPAEPPGPLDQKGPTEVRL